MCCTGAAPIRPGTAVRAATGVATSLANPFVCFLAGTPVLTPEGEKPIEQLQRGDRVRSRHEADVHGPVEDKLVEEVFVREGVVLDLTIAGQVIHTTPEHPFYSQDRGWTPAGQLRPGDLLATLDGRWLPLESARDTGRRETVYNLRVADFHTYFVGSPAWGFGVWVHNSCNNHHPVPKVIGGDADQFLYSVDRAAEHTPFHHAFAANLKATGFPLSPLGGRGNSAQAFEDLFVATKGLQRRVFDILIRTAREFDSANGTKYLDFVKHNIRRLNYTEINW